MFTKFLKSFISDLVEGLGNYSLPSSRLPVYGDETRQSRSPALLAAVTASRSARDFASSVYPVGAVPDEYPTFAHGHQKTVNTFSQIENACLQYLIRTIPTLQKYNNVKTTGFAAFPLPKVSFRCTL